MSTCGEVGPDVHALVKELVIRRVELGPEVHSEESRRLAQGMEIARLRRRFSFVLQQALSFRTRHHLCRQGVTLSDSHHLRPQDDRTQGREGGAADDIGERSAGETEPATPPQETNRVVDLGEQMGRRDVMGENPPCNDVGEEEGEGMPESHKTKRRESVSPVSRLIRGFRDGNNR